MRRTPCGSHARRFNSFNHRSHLVNDLNVLNQGETFVKSRICVNVGASITSVIDLFDSVFTWMENSAKLRTSFFVAYGHESKRLEQEAYEQGGRASARRERGFREAVG